MSRRLPVVVDRTIEDLRAKADPAAGPAAKPAAVPAPDEPAPAQRPNRRRKPAAAAPTAANPPSPPLLAPPPVAAPVPDPRRSARHREALRIVDRHATYAAVGGLIPLPLVDLAGVTAIIVRMVGGLARLYDVPARPERVRALAMGLMSGAGSLALGAVASTGMMRLVPGANLAGLALTSIAAGRCARYVGMLFVAHFENGGTLLDFEPPR